MSSPSSSSSATAGRLRWTRPRRPRRRSVIAWGAAACTAAALYLTPSFLILLLSGEAWAIAPLVVCVAVLVRYSRVFGSRLGLLLTLVLIALVEFLVQVGTAVAQTCGDSRSATILEWSGIAVLLIGIGGFGAHRRRVLPVVAALVVAGAWIALVAHLVPGGSGECFN
jgi:hypothetical protein